MKAMISYSHMVELVPGKESRLTGYMFFFNEAVLIISPLILLYLSKNTYIFLSISFGLNILITIICMTFYIPESIRFLLNK